jgi:hypothetical protein
MAVRPPRIAAVAARATHPITDMVSTTAVVMCTISPGVVDASTGTNAAPIVTAHPVARMIEDVSGRRDPAGSRVINEAGQELGGVVVHRP